MLSPRVGLIGVRQGPRTRKAKVWPVIRTETGKNKKGPSYQKWGTEWDTASGRRCGSTPQGHRGPRVRPIWARDSLVNAFLTEDRGLKQ